MFAFLFERWIVYVFVVNFHCNITYLFKHQLHINYMENFEECWIRNTEICHNPFHVRELCSRGSRPKINDISLPIMNGYGV